MLLVRSSHILSMTNLDDRLIPDKKPDWPPLDYNQIDTNK